MYFCKRDEFYVKIIVKFVTFTEIHTSLTGKHGKTVYSSLYFCNRDEFFGYFDEFLGIYVKITEEFITITEIQVLVNTGNGIPTYIFCNRDEFYAYFDVNSKFVPK